MERKINVNKIMEIFNLKEDSKNIKIENLPALFCKMISIDTIKGFHYTIVENFMEYDEHNNLIKYTGKFTDDETRVNDYDENGNLIHTKSSDGYESWYEYDNKGNIISEKDNKGYEKHYEYDEEGKILMSSDTDGNIEKYENGKLIYERNVDFDVSYTYDDKGNITHSIYNNIPVKCDYIYDNKGNNIMKKYSNGDEEYFEYDDKGNLIYSKRPNVEVKYTYENDKLIEVKLYSNDELCNYYKFNYNDDGSYYKTEYKISSGIYYYVIYETRDSNDNITSIITFNHVSDEQFKSLLAIEE